MLLQKFGVLDMLLKKLHFIVLIQIITDQHSVVQHSVYTIYELLTACQCQYF